MLVLKRVCESKQVGTLYHVCTIDAVSNFIAPKDTLSSSGQFFNQMLKRTDCISFTRSKNLIVDTPRNRKALMLIRFAVDGNSLSEHYKIKPYNDSYYDPETDTMIHYPAKDREGEEIVIGKIYPFSDYVQSVEISLSKNIMDLNKNNLQTFMQDFNSSYSYLSQFKVVYNPDLCIAKGTTMKLSSLSDCKELLESLVDKEGNQMSEDWTHDISMR